MDVFCEPLIACRSIWRLGVGQVCIKVSGQLADRKLDDIIGMEFQWHRGQAYMIVYIYVEVAIRENLETWHQ